MLSSGCQPSHLKRKRRPSDQSLEEIQDIENLPTNDEKKYKDDSRILEPSCSFEREGEVRLPFSELKMVPSSQDYNIDSIVSDQERLSISEDAETTSISSSCDVACLSDLSPSPTPCLLTPGTSSLRSPRSSDCEELATERLNPLPPLDWADLPSLWQLMCDKDEESLKTRDPDMFSRHPSLQGRMRGVLLEWICEVSEVYKLHRETYYLAMDYIDRYLSTQNDIPKQQLQLIGITCLQLAAKNEEIYPPKVPEYAYVTDGACSDKEIIAKELVICKALDWRLSPMTPLYWLKVFMQLTYQGHARHNLGFLFPQYSVQLYIRVVRLLDLSTMDYGSLRFSYSMIAASALYLACNAHLAVIVSGLTEEDLLPCVDWMTPFWDVLKEEVPDYNKKMNKLLPGCSKGSMTDDGPNRQKHFVTLAMMDAAVAEAANRAPSCLLTPPASSKKASQGLSFT